MPNTVFENVKCSCDEYKQYVKIKNICVSQKLATIPILVEMGYTVLQYPMCGQNSPRILMKVIWGYEKLREMMPEMLAPEAELHIPTHPYQPFEDPSASCWVNFL